MQTTINFFKSVHRVINFKIPLHHLQVIEKIVDYYARDFCNMKVTENQKQFSCIA